MRSDLRQIGLDLAQEISAAQTFTLLMTLIWPEVHFMEKIK